VTSIIYSGVYNCYAEMTLELPDGKSIDDVVNSWDKWGTAYVELNSGEIIKAEIVDLDINNVDWKRMSDTNYVECTTDFEDELDADKQWGHIKEKMIQAVREAD